MIDLEEIKRHRALWTPEDSTSLPTICEHVDALVEEVERLRELLLNAGWPRESEGLATLALQYERAAVVAWLREQAADWEGLGADACIHEANTIERGEHREEEKP